MSVPNSDIDTILDALLLRHAEKVKAICTRDSPEGRKDLHGEYDGVILASNLFADAYATARWEIRALVTQYADEAARSQRGLTPGKVPRKPTDRASPSEEAPLPPLRRPVRR